MKFTLRVKSDFQASRVKEEQNRSGFDDGDDDDEVPLVSTMFEIANV